MLLKCTNSDRKTVPPSKGKGSMIRGTAMRMTMATASTMTSRIHRKGFRTPSKRHPGKVLPGKLHSISRVGPGKIAPGKRINPRPHPPPCDNSNDSGIGFDQHVEIPQQIVRHVPASRSEPLDESSCSDDYDEVINRSDLRLKRRKVESTIQIDNEDACSNDAFTQKIIATSTMDDTVSPIELNTKCISTVARNNMRPAVKRPAIPVQSNISTTSKNGSVQLQIISQPETQHRARYQTEGSRGAVKDRSGNGFPIVRLTGYNKTAVLQVFIGTDVGRVAPHMFYQACKVAGKNSTPCNEKKIEGTMLIEIDFKPEGDMTVTCDCVGILKERNVDVEHRFPEHTGQRSKKKSTRCRMVFRTQITHDDGTIETLQVCSHPIICTQPPGVPEICKKSLTSSPVEGGLELYIIGKNFLKDTCVIFQHNIEGTSNQNDLNQLRPIWEETVLPDKEYLQQTHLICTVPPYINQNIVEPITVHVFVMSSGKKSESHNFMYTPRGTHSILSAATTLATLHGTISSQKDGRYGDTTNNQSCPVMLWGRNVIEPKHEIELKHEIDSGMMPPPTSLPLAVRRPSTSGNLLAEQLTQIGLKSEMLDENSQSSSPDTMQTDSLDQFPSVVNENSMDNGPLKMPYQRCRKQSVDIIDMRSMSSLINDTNSLPSFPTHSDHSRMSAVDMQIKQEEITNQIQSQIIAAATQSQSNVSKFLNELKSPLNTGAVDSIFSTNSVNTNSNSIVYSPQDLNPMNGLTAGTGSNIVNQTFAQSLMATAAVTAVATSNPSQNLMNMVQADSPKSMRSPTSSSSSSHSPVAQDIILNSEPAASINSVNIQLMAQQNNSPPEHLSSEMIMNPTVSPSMMCPSSTDPSSLMVAQDNIQNTILNDMTITPQHSQENLLNTMMINSAAANHQMHAQQKAAAAAANAAAMNNMILKATAEFISNQESAAINAALISLNTNSMLNETTTTVSQILDSMPTATQTVANNSPSLPITDQRMDIPICPATQSSINQHMTHFNDPTAVLTNHQLNNPNNSGTLNSVPLGDLLLNQVSANVQNDFVHNLSKVTPMNTSVNVPTTENPSTMLQAASMIRNQMEKAAVQNQVQPMDITHPVMNPANVTQPTTTTTTIPQEITTMSDQDLISYINPSCFDQV